MIHYTRLIPCGTAFLFAASTAFALEVTVTDFVNGEPIPPGYVDVTDGVPAGAALRVSHPPFVDYIIPANSGAASIVATRVGGLYLSNPADPDVFTNSGSGGGANNLINPDRFQVVFEWEDGEPIPFGEDFYGVSWANWSNTEFAQMITRVDLPDDNPIKVWHWFNDGWDYVGGGHSVLTEGHVLNITHFNAASEVVAEKTFNLINGRATEFFGDNRAFFTAEIVVQRQAPGDYVIIENLGGNIGYKGTVVELLEAVDPTPTTWAGFPLDEGYVDTGDFLGMIFVVGDFIYVFEMSQWMFLPEANVTESGSWTYVFR